MMLNSENIKMMPKEYLAFLQQLSSPGYRPPKRATLSTAEGLIEVFNHDDELDDEKKEKLAKNYLEKLSDIESQELFTQYEDPLFYHMMKTGIDDVSKMIKELGYAEIKNIAFGTLPTPIINGYAILVPGGGKIIALSHGIISTLMELAGTVANFLISSMASDDFISIGYDRKLMDTFNPGHLSFVETMVSYVLTVNSNTLIRSSDTTDERQNSLKVSYPISKPREEFINVIAEALIIFIVAHELSHILLEHSDDRTLSIDIGSRECTMASRSKEEEIEADKLALDITLKCNEEIGYNMVTSYLGIDFLFSCLALFEKASQIKQFDSHPPANERRKLLRIALEKKCGRDAKEAIKIGDDIQQIFDVLWKRFKTHIFQRALEVSN